jgi:hypothetical protein
LLLNAECNDNGGKCKPGKCRPAAAAACSECNNAAECSCALRRNSATELDRGSHSEDDDVVEVDEHDVVVDEDLAGQHEQSPEKAAKKKMRKFN